MISIGLGHEGVNLMRVRSFPFWVVYFFLLFNASCAQRESGVTKTKEIPVREEVSVSADPYRATGDAPGDYRAQRLSGDYRQNKAVDQFIDRLVTQYGFSREYLLGLFSQAKRKQWTLDYLAKEKPTGSPKPGAWTRYRAQFLDDRHISSGVRFWSMHASALKRAYDEYGVSPEYILGILGVETIYGSNLGNHRIIDALTTLSFDYPRRADYFRSELEKFLVMCRGEGVDPSKPKGSYAGAMGLGQFMPSSFLEYAVDFNGDGKKNLWDPEDAIGSVAHYFSGYGWQREARVTLPVKVLGSSIGLKTGYDTSYSPEELEMAGIGLSGSLKAAETGSVSLLRLSSTRGDEYWVGFKNFYVISRYNHSTHYSMAVHQLAQAIRKAYMGLE